jgi:hypothetical protein
VRAGALVRWTVDTIRVHDGPKGLEHGRGQPIHSTHQSVGSRRRRRSDALWSREPRSVELLRLVPQVQGVRGSNPLSPPNLVSNSQGIEEFFGQAGCRPSQLSSLLSHFPISSVTPKGMYAAGSARSDWEVARTVVVNKPRYRGNSTVTSTESQAHHQRHPAQAPQLRPRSPPAAARRPCPCRTGARTSPPRSQPRPAVRPRRPTAARGRRCRRTGPAPSNGPGSRRCC